MIRLLAFTALVLAACPSQAARAAEMTFYQLPAGAYPHDVAPAPDGTVWISGQRQGFAGRFDPKTGHLEKIALGPGAAPHGVIVGADGNAWLTEGGQNAIARVDARTKEVKLFPLPKEFPNANLNTLVFDGKGTLWYTGQNGVVLNKVGASGMSAISPFGAPASTHFAIVSISCSDSEGSSRISLMPTVGSKFQGGISRLLTRVLIDRAHGRASS